ncbi:MAG: phosphatase PAP2 family protein [Rickettsiales bacterium]|nr:phosphatase PAP2 family protein [Rickettsiales bacterium]
MGDSKIFQTYKNKNIDLLILTTLLLIILTLFLIKLSNIDIFIQNYFFDFTAREWLIDKGEPFKKNIFHRLPKIIFGFLIFLSIVFALKYRKNNYFRYQQALLMIIGLTVNPMISANIKKFTNIYCPAQLKIYDGNYDYHKIFYINQISMLLCFMLSAVIARIFFTIKINKFNQ